MAIVTCAGESDILTLWARSPELMTAFLEWLPSKLDEVGTILRECLPK